MLRILIADDHPILRSGMQAVLNAQTSWRVVGEAEHGQEAVKLALDASPDVVVLDHFMPKLNGLEATREILRTRPNTRIVVYTFCDNDALVRNILRAGAKAYVLKSDARRVLIEAVSAVADGKPFLTPRISRILINAAIANLDKDILTFRERQLVRLASEGYTNKQMAIALDITVKTVETHRAAIMSKLDLGSFASLVRYAIRNNIVEA